MKSLTLKQKQFADEYIRTGNAYQSAVNAGYSVSYARGNAIKLLENVSINQYIDDNLEIIQKESIAEADEIMRYLTRVLRAEEKKKYWYMWATVCKKFKQYDLVSKTE